MLFAGLKGLLFFHIFEHESSSNIPKVNGSSIFVPIFRQNSNHLRDHLHQQSWAYLVVPLEAHIGTLGVIGTPSHYIGMAVPYKS